MARWLLDTNVLLRLQEGDDSNAYRAVMSLGQSGEILCVTPQVLIEFWCAATRPKDARGLGWTIMGTATRVKGILNRFHLLDDRTDVFELWQQIVKRHAVKGKKVHDARLVAVMQSHGVKNLLTFNVDDFDGFGEIQTVHPGSIG